MIPSGRSPDASAAGFLAGHPSYRRYDHIDDDPREVARLLAGFIPRGCRVLDVGCGTGALSCFIGRLRRVQVTGVEPDGERARLARDRGIDVVGAYLTRELLSTLGEFDAVLLADVLEHVPDPTALLRLACTALKREGLVVLSVPNVAHWLVRWNLLRGRFHYEQYGIMDATHLRWFTLDSLVNWLRNNGLRVERTAHSAGAWIPVYRSWPWRLALMGHRSAVLGLFASQWPRLFGCQHVIRAVRSGG